MRKAETLLTTVSFVDESFAEDITAEYEAFCRHWGGIVLDLDTRIALAEKPIHLFGAMDDGDLVRLIAENKHKPYDPESALYYPSLDIWKEDGDFMCRYEKPGNPEFPITLLAATVSAFQRVGLRCEELPAVQRNGFLCGLIYDVDDVIPVRFGPIQQAEMLE